ncbi:hypothetical protein [Streptococcus sanguinis]|uniref:hypothetical protein n=1 Tax=Streptococcus sanguinis TaxID=1305 RepID=UPI001CBEB811|nr:hypothetical protein [Streptococcus sanguinis]MBZ2074289.1 hypothetical protein [Streptococcus sanguinis]MBZ2082419.1 hypothetical protein [Streptococcus sanguinis]MCC3165892.1 hypothetical protein [Streptococcus sanguinis]
MKKIFKSKLIRILLLLLTTIGLYFAYETYRRHQLTQFVMWSPRAKIADYEFIYDNKAVAIDWDNEAELNEAEEAKKYDSRIKVEKMMRVNGKRYIVQQSYKLKSASYKYWNLEEDAVPFLKSNTPENGEYWLLDVYDTKGGKIKQKTYDVFKMVREYNKDYIPRMIPDFNQALLTEQGKTYLPINMVVSRKPKFKSEYGVIELESGKILPATPSGLTGKELSNVFKVNSSLNKKSDFEDILNQNDKLSDQRFSFVLSIFGFKESLQKNQDTFLANKYPKAFDILRKGLLSELYFLGKEDVRFKISFLKLVVPKETNIFKELTIPATSSKDGREHIVQSEEEFLQYYQSSSEEE